LEHRCEVQACGPHYQQAVRALLERLLNLVESLTVGEQTPPDAEAADEQRDEPRSSSEHLAVALCKAAALGVDAGEGSGWVTAACRGLLRNLGALSAATLVNVASAIYTLCGGSQGCTTIQTLAAEALGRLSILKSHERGELLQALDSAAPRSGARRGTEGYDESTPFAFAVLCALAGDIARDGARLSDRSLVGLAWVSAAFGFRGTEVPYVLAQEVPKRAGNFHDEELVDLLWACLRLGDAAAGPLEEIASECCDRVPSFGSGALVALAKTLSAAGHASERPWASRLRRGAALAAGRQTEQLKDSELLGLLANLASTCDARLLVPMADEVSSRARSGDAVGAATLAAAVKVLALAAPGEDPSSIRQIAYLLRCSAARSLELSAGQLVAAAVAASVCIGCTSPALAGADLSGLGRELAEQAAARAHELQSGSELAELASVLRRLGADGPLPMAAVAEAVAGLAPATALSAAKVRRPAPGSSALRDLLPEEAQRLAILLADSGISHCEAAISLASAAARPRFLSTAAGKAACWSTEGDGELDLSVLAKALVRLVGSSLGERGLSHELGLAAIRCRQSLKPASAATLTAVLATLGHPLEAAAAEALCSCLAAGLSEGAAVVTLEWAKAVDFLEVFASGTPGWPRLAAAVDASVREPLARRVLAVAGGRGGAPPRTLQAALGELAQSLPQGSSGASSSSNGLHGRGSSSSSGMGARFTRRVLTELMVFAEITESWATTSCTAAAAARAAARSCSARSARGKSALPSVAVVSFEFSAEAASGGKGGPGRLRGVCVAVPPSQRVLTSRSKTASGRELEALDSDASRDVFASSSSAPSAAPSARGASVGGSSLVTLPGVPFLGMPGTDPIACADTAALCEACAALLQQVVSGGAAGEWRLASSGDSGRSAGLGLAALAASAVGVGGEGEEEEVLLWAPGGFPCGMAELQIFRPARTTGRVRLLSSSQSLDPTVLALLAQFLRVFPNVDVSVALGDGRASSREAQASVSRCQSRSPQRHVVAMPCAFLQQSSTVATTTTPFTSWQELTPLSTGGARSRSPSPADLLVSPAMSAVLSGPRGGSSSPSAFRTVQQQHMRLGDRLVERVDGGISFSGALGGGSFGSGSLLVPGQGTTALTACPTTTSNGRSAWQHPFASHPQASSRSPSPTPRFSNNLTTASTSARLHPSAPARGSTPVLLRRGHGTASVPLLPAAGGFGAGPAARSVSPMLRCRGGENHARRLLRPPPPPPQWMTERKDGEQRLQQHWPAASGIASASLPPGLMPLPWGLPAPLPITQPPSVAPSGGIIPLAGGSAAVPAGGHFVWPPSSPSPLVSPML